MVGKLRPDNTTSLQFYQLIRYGSLMLIGILFAKSGLTKAEIGNYELLIFISAAIGFWVSGNIQSMLSSYSNAGTEEKPSIIFNVAIIVSGYSILCFILIRVFSDPMQTLLSLENSINYLDIFSWYILLINPTFLIEYIYLLKNKPGKIIQYGILSFAVQLLLVVIPVFVYDSLEMAIWGLVLSAIIRFIWLITVLYKYAKFKINKDFILQHSKASSPLVFASLIGGSGQYIDNLLISKVFDQDTYAVYRYGAREMPLALLLANALSNSFIFRLNQESLRKGLKNLKRKANNLMHLLFPLSIILLLISHWFFPIIYNPEFKESATVFNIYLLLIMGRLVFPQTILLSKGKNKIILYTALVEMIINIGLSLYLIRDFGIAGVAFATVVAFAFEKIMLSIFTWKYLGIKPSKYISAQIIIPYTLAILIVFFLVESSILF